VIGVSQTSFELHVTVADVAAPVSSIRASGEELLPPLASFQLGSGMTPATSVGAIATSSPTKSTPMALPEPPLEDITISVAVVVFVSELPVPLIVKVELPVGVLLAVVIVSVALPPTLTDVGLNVPVALAGRPLTLRLIVPVKPLTALVLTEYEVPPPGFTVCELGVADSVNDAGPVTLRVTFVVLVSEPLVPVIVRAKLPAGVLLAVVIVTVELLPTLTEAGLKVAVALAGSPLTLKPIEPAKPFKALVLTEYEVPPPGLTVWELGAAETVNAGVGVNGTI